MYYQMGATVIVASRSEVKCHNTVVQMEARIPDAHGKAIGKAVDLSDFQNVKDFVAWYRSNFDRLDCLVNNGAINYIGAKAGDSLMQQNKKGLDLLFSTNYLGHFILTERLLPILKQTKQARIVQVSSNSQYLVSGDDLLPSENGGYPRAALALDDSEHHASAYGNSKLAQMLHAKELQLILDSDPSTDLKV